MNSSKLAPLGLILLGGLAVVGLVVLAVLREPIPDVLPYLALSSASALGGAALPTRQPSSDVVPTEQPPTPPRTYPVALIQPAIDAYAARRAAVVVEQPPAQPVQPVQPSKAAA